MGISRKEFRQRHNKRIHHFTRTGALRRAAQRVAFEHAGSAITAWATVVAVGGGLLALGLVETSGVSASHPNLPASPLHNGWVVAGLVILVVGAALAIGNVGYLIVRQMAKERWVAHLVQLTWRGQSWLDTLQTVGGPVGVDEIANWYAEVRDDLLADDPTGSMLVRWEQGGTTDLIEHQRSKTEFLKARTERLTEFLAELR